MKLEYRLEDGSEAMTFSRATQALKAEARACRAESLPEILLCRSRRYCSSCMKRKTYWLFIYGPFIKIRQCWKCMDVRVFRDGY